MIKTSFHTSKGYDILMKFLPNISNDLVLIIAHYVVFTRFVKDRIYFCVPEFFNKTNPPHELLKNPTVVKRNVVIRFLLVEGNLSEDTVGEIFNISSKAAFLAGNSVKNSARLPEESKEFYANLINLFTSSNNSKLSTGTNEEKITQIFKDELDNLIERKCAAMGEIDAINEQLINTYKTNSAAIKDMFSSYYLKAFGIYNERLTAFGELSIKELETQKFPEAFKMSYDKTGKQWHRHSLFLRDAKDIFNTDILTEDLRIAINDLGTKWIKLDLMICNWNTVYENNLSCVSKGYGEIAKSIDLNRSNLCQSQNIFGK